MDNNLRDQYLLAQAAKKRELRNKCLRNGGTSSPKKNEKASSLRDLVMTNVMLISIDKKKDIFGIIRDITKESSKNPLNQDTLLDMSLNVLEELAEAIECSPYEFFIEDNARKKRIISKLITNLEKENYDNWEEIRCDQSGNATFELQHFDYYYRMTDCPQAEVSLVFQKLIQSDGGYIYRLMIGDISHGIHSELISTYAILYEENEGLLSSFIESILSMLKNGWLVMKEKLDYTRIMIEKEIEKMQDLALAAAELPLSVNFSGILIKEAENIDQISKRDSEIFAQMSADVRNGERGEMLKSRILLLKGAITCIQNILLKIKADPVHTKEFVYEGLQNIIFLLEDAEKICL